MLYYSYIYSKIQHGVEAYNIANIITLNKDQRTTQGFENTLQLVQGIYKINITKVVFRQRNQLLPDIFNNQFY